MEPLLERKFALMNIVAHTYSYVVGVDTHARSHALAIIDAVTAAEIDAAQFPSTPAGLARCCAWVARHTNVDPDRVLISMEGTSSYGAGLREALETCGFYVVEAPRVLIKGRKRNAKTDLIDAIAIATRTLPVSLSNLTVPRDGDARQALRILLASRTQITRATTAAINALTALVRTNDLGVDARHPLSKKQIRTISAWRTRDSDTLSRGIARAEAKRLAQTISSHWETSKENLVALDELTGALSPELCNTIGVGPVSAAQFLTAWSHPGRIQSAPSFVALAGASPIPASSGNTTRHRLNRGGDRQLNQALHNVILVRMRFDEETRSYVEKRTAEGKSKREIMRCLKRYLARKIHRTLTAEHTTQAKDNTIKIAA